MAAVATVAPLSVPSPHSAKAHSRSIHDIASPTAVTPDMCATGVAELAVQQAPACEEPTLQPPVSGLLPSASDAPEPAMETAATKIQALQRGRAVRQAVRAKTTASDTGAEAAQPEVAAPSSPATSSNSLPVWRAIILVQRRFRRLKAEAQRKLRQMLLRQQLLEEKRVQERLARGSKGRRAKAHELMGAGEMLSSNAATMEKHRPPTLQASNRGPLTPQLSPLSPVQSQFHSLPNSPLMQANVGPPLALEGLPPLNRNGSMGVTARSLRSPGRIAGKAADLLFGGAKANPDKRLDKLGVSAAELSLFDQNPRAFNKLGVGSKQQHHPPSSGSVELEVESGMVRDAHARKNSQAVEALAAGEAAREMAEREERERKEREARAEKERIERERQEEEERERQREAQLAARPTEASSLTGKAAQLLLGINKADRRGSLEGGKRRTSVSVPSRPLSANSPDQAGAEAAQAAAEQSIVSHSHKVLDKLGVTAKQLEMFPVAQSRAFVKLGVDQPHRPSDSTEASAHHLSHAEADAEAMRLSEAAAEAARLAAQEAAHAPKKQSSKKVSALTLGVTKQDKVRDKLGVSPKEMQLLQENPVAFKKLGLFHEDRPGSSRSPSSAHLLPPSVLLNPPAEPEPYVDPASVRPASNAALGKAQGLLGGVAKRQGPGAKEQTQLGISKKEREIFADKQKAYQQLGVFEQQALRKAMLQAAEDYKASDRQHPSIPNSLAPIPGQRTASMLSSSHSTPYLPSTQHSSATLATANTRVGARLAPLSRVPSGAGTTPTNSKWGRMKGQLASRTSPNGLRSAAGGSMSYSQSLASLPSLSSSHLSAYRNTGLFSVVLAAKRHSALNANSPSGSPQRPKQAPSIASTSNPAVGDARSLGISGTAMQLNPSNPGTPVRSPARSRVHSRNPSRSQLLVDGVSTSMSGLHSRSIADRSPSQSASPAPPEDSQQYSTWNSTSQSHSSSSALSVPSGSSQQRLHSLSPNKSSLSPLPASPSSTSPLNPRSPLSST